MKTNKICQSCGMPMSKDPKNGGTEHQLPTCGIFYCRDILMFRKKVYKKLKVHLMIYNIYFIFAFRNKVLFYSAYTFKIGYIAI
jgi:predicted RNA-binding Zn-ribbon protein involved in translation (DUF1610 family)